MPPKRKAANNEDASKRLKVEDENQSLITETLFFTDVVSVLFSFLDLKQLLKFVCVSKEYERRLTYEHVVRAALISGGFPQTSLERMLRPVRERKIWVPSPLRLLRVVCGKRCEGCNNGRARYVCESFAVFLCYPCLEKSTKLLRKSKKWKPYLEAPGVILGPRGGPKAPHSYLLVTPMKDRGGNKIGPLVTADDIEAMEEERQEESSTTPAVEKVAAWIKQCSAQQPDAEKARQEILDAADNSRQYAEDRKAARKQEKKEISLKNQDAKRKNCDKVIQKLVMLVKDDQDLIARIESREWNVVGKLYVFQDEILQMVLATSLKTPSKLNNKKLQELADELQRLVENQRLAHQHIQKIIALVDDEEVNKVMHFVWANWKRCYHFENDDIRAILEEPLRNPKSLTDEDLKKMAMQAKTIVTRKAQVDSILERLEERLKGLTYANDIKIRMWNEQCWCYTFNETYVQEILYKPLLSPEDITDEKFDDLAKQLEEIMTKMAVFSGYCKK